MAAMDTGSKPSVLNFEAGFGQATSWKRNDMQVDTQDRRLDTQAGRPAIDTFFSGSPRSSLSPNGRDPRLHIILEEKENDEETQEAVPGAVPGDEDLLTAHAKALPSILFPPGPTPNLLFALPTFVDEQQRKEKVGDEDCCDPTILLDRVLKLIRHLLDSGYSTAEQNASGKNALEFAFAMVSLEPLSTWALGKCLDPEGKDRKVAKMMGIARKAARRLAAAGAKAEEPADQLADKPAAPIRRASHPAVEVEESLERWDYRMLKARAKALPEILFPIADRRNLLFALPMYVDEVRRHSGMPLCNPPAEFLERLAKLVELLLAKGHDSQDRNASGRTALEFAFELEPVSAWVLGRALDPAGLDKNVCSMLLRASKALGMALPPGLESVGDKTVVKTRCAKFADPAVLEYRKLKIYADTLPEILFPMVNAQTRNLLFALPTYVDEARQNRGTPLSIPSILNLIRVLLNKGFCPKETNNTGKNALQFASALAKLEPVTTWALATVMDAKGQDAQIQKMKLRALDVMVQSFPQQYQEIQALQSN